MSHPSEGDLILHYYGEDVSAAVEAHLASCAECAEALARLRARERRQESADPMVVNDASNGPATELPSGEPAPDRLVFGGEVRRRVSLAMLRMSALEKSAFTLRHFEGMSIEEIGRALDLDASAAKQSVFRAVRKVREALGRDPGLRPTT